MIVSQLEFKVKIAFKDYIPSAIMDINLEGFLNTMIRANTHEPFLLEVVNVTKQEALKEAQKMEVEE